MLYGQVYEALRNQTNKLGIKPPEAPIAAPAAEEVASPFQPKSVWTTDKRNTILTVIERKGETFLATWNSADGAHQKMVTGTVKGNQVEWLAKDARVIKGNSATNDHFGTITPGKDEDKIEFVWRSAGNKQSGTFTLHRRNSK